MLILGIDTSCDDTGIGIVRGGRVLSNIVASQAALHADYGGVVPERASREHLVVIDRVCRQALEEAGVALAEVDGVAATYGPGLVGALLVGLNFGKSLAWSLGIPFKAVHHLEGHIASSLAAGDVTPPFLCLIASGGHTILFDVRGWDDIVELGRSRDDAAGEAFDKVARLLDLGYPGGPALSKAAARGDEHAHRFTMPLQGQAGFDFSFSGLKTAVALLVDREEGLAVCDVAASFERVVVESLYEVTMRAARATGRRTLVIAGGVAANSRLRKRFASSGLPVLFPPLSLATDNGAMIALAAERRLGAGFETDWTVDAAPYVPLGTSQRSKARS